MDATGAAIGTIGLAAFAVFIWREIASNSRSGPGGQPGGAQTKVGRGVAARFDAFTFRLKPEIHEMELADTVRVEVAVQYRTKAWQTVNIDFGPGGARKADLVTRVVPGLTDTTPAPRRLYCALLWRRLVPACM